MTPTSARVFVSCAAELTTAQQELAQSWLARLRALELEPSSLARSAYAPVPWEQLRSALMGSDGVLILGFRQLRVDEGEYRPHTSEARAADDWFATSWNHLEAGMALALGLPLLVVPDQDVGEGIFESATWGEGVYGAPMDASASAIEPWAARVREHAKAQIQSRA